MCIWAEKKVQQQFPGEQGLGADKYSMVAYQLIQKIKPGMPWFIKPFIKPDQKKIKEVIEKNVSKMEEILAKKAQEHKVQ